MQRIRYQIEKWSNETSFRFSIGKKKVVNFGKEKRPKNDLGLNLYKNKIEDVCSNRFLEVIIRAALVVAFQLFCSFFLICSFFYKFCSFLSFFSKKYP